VAVASAGLYASLHLIPDNHANIPPLSFLQAGCPSCLPTNSVKALKAKLQTLPKIDKKFFRPILMKLGMMLEVDETFTMI